ncbi:MAG: hypothetical protein O2955_07200 [Planctomycetota bacterium]|nr:hypothetical protein [Planctomycetota bacterium]MDA1212284.1 hypothetical protein [Planctomycetota bacterium]
MYMPVLARFTARDPLPQNESVLLGEIPEHAYSYVNSNPVNQIDPSGFLTLTARVFAASAFKTYWRHLCIEADSWETCTVGCDEKLEGKTTYTLELLHYTGRDLTGKVLAPVAERVGLGPGGFGPILSDGRFFPAGAKKAWGIFVYKGAHCRGKTQGTIVVLKDPANPGQGLGDQKQQCELAECLIDEAKKIAAAADGKVKYDVTKRNSNSFVGQAVRGCKGHVDDAFVAAVISNGKAIGVLNDFS